MWIEVIFTGRNYFSFHIRMCYTNTIVSYFYCCIQTSMRFHFLFTQHSRTSVYRQNNGFSGSAQFTSKHSSNALFDKKLLAKAIAAVLHRHPVLWLPSPQLTGFAFRQQNHSGHKHPLVKGLFQFLHRGSSR